MNNNIYKKLKKRNLRWEKQKPEQSIIHKISRAKAERRYKGIRGTSRMSYDIIKTVLKRLIWR